MYNDLYRPPHKQLVTSADQPIAGQGYNSLPFVFDLVSLCNGLRVPNTTTAKSLEQPPPSDSDGLKTLEMLHNVNQRIELVSTNSSGSLGLHPLIYYYAKSGVFLPSAFLASLEFSKRLDAQNRKKDFTIIRRKFEDYIFENKSFVSLTAARLGSGARSLGRIANLFWEIFEGLHSGKSTTEIYNELISKGDYVHLKIADIPPPNHDLHPSTRGASRQSKSAAFIRSAMANPVRCPICEGAVHANSMTFDHDNRKADGGSNYSDNLHPSHPFCNSGVKN